MEARVWARSVRPAAFLLAAVVIVAACSPNPNPSSPPAVASSTPAPSATSTATSPASTSPSAEPSSIERPLAASGSIALRRADGTMWVIDADGHAADLTDASDGAFGFPTWSPDGTLIAATRATAEGTSVVVIDVARASTGLPIGPRVIFSDPAVSPFYLSWTPDGKTVSFLASDAESMKLRLAPADGSAPLDGSGPGAVIRDGEPFYFDWIDSEHLFAHIGSGPDAFLGEIGSDGAAAAAAIKAPGSFRNGDVSADGRFVAYVRDGPVVEDAVVVAARDGSSEHSIPVFGMVAIDFDPTGTQLASIGSIEPLAHPEDSFPLGPLRLIDAGTGEARTLLEGNVVSFAWSPDGRTIAAIRLVQADGGTNAASPSPAPSQEAPTNEIRLTFVDVASGKIRSETEVAPGDTFVRSLLLYFDQYALSHRLWAPDSSSILVPQTEPNGATHVDVFFPDGGDPIALEGEIGFWSP
jgi:TolB protein